MQGVSRVVEGLIQQMRTADKEDRGGLAGQIESSLKPLEGAMRANIASTGADRNPHQVEFLKQLDSYRTQYKGIMMPSKEELAQAKRDAATAARGERTAERNDQRPLVTRQDLIDVTKSIFGDRVRVGSGYRSQAQQDAIHSRTKAKVSAHTDSLAQDFPTGPVSDAVGKQMALQLENTLKQRGIPTKLVQYENGKNGNGTGPHIHVGLAKGTRYASGSDKDGTLTSGRIDLSNENLAVKNADKELKSTFSDLKLATSEAVFKEGTTAAEAAFEKWKQALITQVDQEIATSGGMSDGQQAERKAERDAQIKAKRDELDSAVFDGILKNFDAQKKAIDKAFNEKTRASREGVTRAQSTIEGFGYYSNRNRIPDYVQTLAANRLGRAQESAARDKLNKLPETIKDSQALLSQMNATLSHTENKAEAETLKVKIDELTASIKDLRAEKEALDQSFGAGDLVPKTVREGLDQAITAYRETHNLTNSFSQDLIDNMGGALTTVHEGLTTMFGDILSGSTSVLAAFGNFVQGMIKFMIQLAAKALATKVFDLILSTIGSAAGGKISASSAPLGPPITVAFEGGGNIGGGWVPGLLGGGGRVTQGSATRDSVRAMIAKDEWVVNKKATDSVGHDFMRRLNSQGAAALDAMRGSPIILPQGKNETNVYVVKPNERPQLGKNDILLVVHEDILANGETKKLIHHVSQGG